MVPVSVSLCKRIRRRNHREPCIEGEDRMTDSKTNLELKDIDDVIVMFLPAISECGFIDIPLTYRGAQNLKRVWKSVKEGKE